MGFHGAGRWSGCQWMPATPHQWGPPISSREEIWEVMTHAMIGCLGSNTWRAINCGAAWSKFWWRNSNRLWSGREGWCQSGWVWGRRGHDDTAHVVDSTLCSIWAALIPTRWDGQHIRARHSRSQGADTTAGDEVTNYGKPLKTRSPSASWMDPGTCTVWSKQYSTLITV